MYLLFYRVQSSGVIRIALSSSILEQFSISKGQRGIGEGGDPIRVQVVDGMYVSNVLVRLPMMVSGLVYRRLPLQRLSCGWKLGAGIEREGH